MKPSLSENYTYKIENLSTGYNAGAGRGHDVAGQKVLLRNMDTRLARGVLTCLIGVNGAGKGL